jgi:uncharacterized damage-inducible protein DinB
MHSPGSLVLLETLERNQEVIYTELAGITHAESLIQPTFNANCINWVVGHILSSRDNCLKLLDLPPVLTEAETSTYDYGSERLTGTEKAIDFSELLARLDASFTSLSDHLKSLQSADLEKEVHLWKKPQPLGGMLAFFFWHEAYHIGQLNLLRQVAGKNDKTI